MNTSTEVPALASQVRRPDRIAGGCLLLGGVAFVAGGGSHPGDSGTGSKVSQLHEMLVDPLWYPSHALLVVAMAAFAVAALVLRRRGDLDMTMRRVSGVVSVVAVLATVAMVLHLFAATEAAAIADGGTTVMYHVHAWNETIVNPLWGLGVAALAVAGGLTRTFGHPVTLVPGLVGGVAFALASGTIAVTDRFDPLFAVGSLIGVWGIVVGLVLLVRHRAPTPDEHRGSR